MSVYDVVIVQGNVRTIILDSFHSLQDVVAWMHANSVREFGSGCYMCHNRAASNTRHDVWDIRVGNKVCANMWYEVSFG